MLENSDVDRVVVGRRRWSRFLKRGASPTSSSASRGAGQRGRRTQPPVADRAQQLGRGIQQVDDARGDLDRPRPHHQRNAPQGRPGRQAHRRRSGRRAPAPAGPAERRNRSRVRADGVRAARANELRSLGWRSRKIRADADRQPGHPPTLSQRKRSRARARQALGHLRHRHLGRTPSSGPSIAASGRTSRRSAARTTSWCSARASSSSTSRIQAGTRARRPAK